MNESPERRAKLLQVAAGAAFLALAVVIALIVVNASGGGDGGDTSLEGASEVNRSLQGIPQEEMLLGDPEAPVELVEFGDLQCPYCAAYAGEILPPIIENQVKKGQLKIDFRNFTIIGPDSAEAGAAALAAGVQGRGWNFVELFYRNQGGENEGYAADEAFLEAVAKGAGVKDLDRWNEDRALKTAEVEETTAEAQQLGIEGTPTFAIRGPKTDGLEVIGTPDSTSALEEAIEGAR
ncbi:MAG TPA: thioredoxin domain-containing protein [Solirubrobacterales bacterium]|nr:thioredoxin domain-containing protein [Solirubrobacterales bacterium]